MARRHLLMLLALASIWGASFMLIKVAVRGGLAPPTLVLLGVALGTGTLRLRGQRVAATETPA